MSDCPFCEGRKVYLIANTNIEVRCDFCVKGVIPRPKNFDPEKVEPGLLSRITAFFRTDESRGNEMKSDNKPEEKLEEKLEEKPEEKLEEKLEETVDDTPAPRESARERQQRLRNRVLD